MNKKAIIISLAVFVLLAGLTWWWFASLQMMQTAVQQQNQQAETAQTQQQTAQTPATTAPTIDSSDTSINSDLSSIDTQMKDANLTADKILSITAIMTGLQTKFQTRISALPATTNTTAIKALLTDFTAQINGAVTRSQATTNSIFTLKIAVADLRVAKKDADAILNALKQ